MVPIAAKSVTNSKIMKNALAHQQKQVAQGGGVQCTFYENIHSCFFKEYTLWGFFYQTNTHSCI